MKNKIYSLLVILAAICALLFIEDGAQLHEIENDGELYVYFLDVGQGDSTFVVFPDGESMLVDAGNNSDGAEIKESLSSLGIKSIDYVVCTHPHADHIGGMDEIVKSFEIGNIYMPDVYTDTRTFEDLLSAIEEKELDINTAYKGMVVKENEDLSVEFLSPFDKKYDELNEYSIVTRIKYKNNAFLIMGDAHKSNEQDIIAYDQDKAKSDVLRVGHHGSDTSSGADFIKAVNPDIAVISVGEDNDYGHPSGRVMFELESENIEILRTDEDGDILIKSDGNRLEVIKGES